MIARNIDNDEMNDSGTRKVPSTTKTIPKISSSKHWYSVPQPIRRVFDQFPVIVYDQNSAPQKSSKSLDNNVLYVFSNLFDASKSGISCNPTCLKWQAFLRFNGIDFVSRQSNNHASPSGALPFLIPASTSYDPNIMPLSGAKIPRWTSQKLMQEEDILDVQLQVYMSLIDQNIRNAWLYHLYLVDVNFEAVAYPLYVSTTSSNIFVQMTTAKQLRNAAQTELLKSRQMIDGNGVYSAAIRAFEALSTLLGSRNFFSHNDAPGLFDASFFAYSQLLLDDTLPWADRSLSELICQHQNLVNHRKRLLDIYLRS